MRDQPLLRRAVAEFVGTALLLIAVIGSGIAAQRLSPGDVGLELLENALVTGAALVAIILCLGSVSGAHLNPVVSAADAAFGGMRWREVCVYALAQIVGAAAGAVIANAMFSVAAVTIAHHSRSSPNLWLGEVIATTGLLLVIFGVVGSGRVALAPFAVGAYITGAYFFTSSTSFANPAVTLARTLSNTFAGIDPSSVPAFIAAQLVGGAIAVALIRFLWPSVTEVAADVVLPHTTDSAA